jgi:hypothetical protein
MQVLAAARASRGCASSAGSAAKCGHVAGAVVVLLLVLRNPNPAPVIWPMCLPACIEKVTNTALGRKVYFPQTVKKKCMQQH